MIENEPENPYPKMGKVEYHKVDNQPKITTPIPKSNNIPKDLVAYEYNTNSMFSLKSGKYLVVDKHGIIRIETWNSVVNKWEYSDNMITHFYLPKITSLV